MGSARKLPAALIALAAAAVLLAAAATVGVAPPAWSQTGPPPKSPPSAIPQAAIQQVLDELVATGTTTSVIVEIRDGEEVWSGGSGVQDLQTRTPVRADGHFRAGSVTEAFVATVVLQLAGEGKLRLDDTVAQHLPDMIPGGEGITIRQLLNHTSGLFDYAAALDLANPETITENATFKPEQLIQLAAEHDPYFAPGQGWHYSNTNYVLAGLLIEQVTGNPWSHEVARRILRPLDLERTSSPGVQTALSDPHAHAYLPDPGGGELVDVTVSDPSWAGAAGDLISTNADLNRFYHALFAGELLEPELLEEMQNPVATGAPGMSYGLGVHQTALPCGESAWGHDGVVNGFVTDARESTDGERQLAISMTLGMPPSDEATIRQLQELSDRLAELTLCNDD